MTMTKGHWQTFTHSRIASGGVFTFCKSELKWVEISKWAGTSHTVNCFCWFFCRLLNVSNPHRLSFQRHFLVRPTFSSQARRLIPSGFAGMQQAGPWVATSCSMCPSLAWDSRSPQSCVRLVCVLTRIFLTCRGKHVTLKDSRSKS